jgi:hypothetical protein
MNKIGGQAKAMVVTGSRLEAVRYKQEFDRYISEKGYPIKSLVAFSGTVEDDKVSEITCTEVEMNYGLKEKELPETFAKPDYRVLLVAEKYQTGFDQPLLHYYRLQKISEGSINLAEGYATPLDGPREVGTGEVREEYVTLSRLIDIINERFGAELSEADQLFFDQIAEAASQNESLRKAAEVNSLDKFQLVFRQVLESLFIERMELNEELFTDYMSKPELQDVVSKWLGSQVYDRLGGSKYSIVYPKT